MKIPLLVESSPSRIGQCALVRIPKGKWRLVLENWIDSEITISTLPPFEYNNIILEEPRNIQVTFHKKGQERNLSIYLEEIS